MKFKANIPHDRQGVFEVSFHLSPETLQGNTAAGQISFWIECTDGKRKPLMLQKTTAASLAGTCKASGDFYLDEKNIIHLGRVNVKNSLGGIILKSAGKYDPTLPSPVSKAAAPSVPAFLAATAQKKCDNEDSDGDFSLDYN